MDTPQHDHDVVLPAFPPELEITLADGHSGHHHAPLPEEAGVSSMEPLAKRPRLDVAPGSSHPSVEMEMANHRVAAINGSMHESSAVPSSGSLQLDGSSPSSSSVNLSIATEAEEEEGEATDGEPASISIDDGGNIIDHNNDNDNDSTISTGGGDDGLGGSSGGGGGSSGSGSGSGGSDDGALRDAQFDERLRELEEFKAKYGHCRVPQVWKENKRLGQWVATMRNLKKAGKLSLERVKLLEGVGFVWCCRNVTAASKGEKRKMIPWNERFEELKVFKEKYGHCNVPHKWSENVKLSNWLYCQRSFHRHGKLSPDKIKRLESIGFEWSKQDPPAGAASNTGAGAAVVLVKKRKSTTSPSPSSASSAYDLTALGAAGQPPAFAPALGMDHGAMLASLDIHHHQHHHHQQPQPLVVGHHVELLQPAIGQGSAIATDQKDRLMLSAAAAAAAAATLTAGVPKADGENENENEGEGGEGEEEEEAEEEVVYRPSSVKERKSWYERYQELLAFKQEHGHCNVPWKWRDNLPLFYWVRRMKDKKRANALTAEKVALMEEIGFEWVKGQNKEKERRKQQQILIEQKQKELEEEREGLVAAAVRARLLSGSNNGNPAAAADHHQQPPQSNGGVGGGAAAGSVAELIAAQQQQQQQGVGVGVGEQVGMMSPFAYNFPASYATAAGTGGALVSTTYYPVYAKLTSAGASSTGEFTFDPTALAGSSSGVELSMDHNGQHSLYSHAHSDLGAALQHFMGEEMKEGDKEEGMEGMGDALHHHHHHEGMHHEEMVHHHHHLHAMHHVAVSEADGSVHMVEVIQTEPGHLDMSEMSFHEGMPEEEEEEGHHHHHHQEGEHGGQSSMGEMPTNNSQQQEDQTAGEEDAYTTYHHQHHTQEDHTKANQ